MFVLAPSPFSWIFRSSMVHGSAGAGGPSSHRDNMHGTGLGNISGCSGISLGAIPAGWPLVFNFTSDRSLGPLHAPCLGRSRYVGQHTPPLHGQAGDYFSHPWATSLRNHLLALFIPETISSKPHSFFCWRLFQVWLRPRGKMTALDSCVIDDDI